MVVNKNPTDMEIPNHPQARERNEYGAPVDIKEHDWVISNIKFKGTIPQYQPVKEAFATLNPWANLGYVPTVEDPTLSISRWTYRDCPVVEYEGNSLWVSLESKYSPPFAFLQHIANTQDVKVSVNYCPPYKVEWTSKQFTKE